jgi:hypothetical protein
MCLNAVERATSDSNEKVNMAVLEAVLKNNLKVLSKCRFLFEVVKADIYRGLENYLLSSSDQRARFPLHFSGRANCRSSGHGFADA